MSKQQPPDLQQFAEAVSSAAAETAKALAHMNRVLMAQGAIGQAYRGDLEQMNRIIAKIPAEHLPELSAAAALLAASCDEELARRAA